MKFNSVPNILVSHPKMSTIGSIEKPIYIKEFLWQISNTDGVINSQKLLEFINKKTERNVVYKESILNLFIVLFVLGGVGFVGFSLFMKFKSFFLNNYVWMIGSYVKMF